MRESAEGGVALESVNCFITDQPAGLGHIYLNRLFLTDLPGAGTDQGHSLDCQQGYVTAPYRLFGLYGSVLIASIKCPLASFEGQRARSNPTDATAMTVIPKDFSSCFAEIAAAG